MREERSRGRRPVDMDVRRERETLRKGFREILQLGDEATLGEAMRALGLDDQSPEVLAGAGRVAARARAATFAKAASRVARSAGDSFAR